MAKKKRPTDINERAVFIAKIATGEIQEPNSDERKNPKRIEIGRLGGLKGGNARAKKLSAKKRKEIAKKAAKKRWSKK